MMPKFTKNLSGDGTVLSAETSEQMTFEVNMGALMYFVLGCVAVAAVARWLLHLTRIDG
jgi:uncharacterized membrane protein YedE/YeeE